MSAGLRVGDDVAWTEGAARVVALDLVDPRATPYALEGTAVAVWRVIEEHPGIALDELLQRLVEAFDATEEQIRADVEALLHDLLARRLIVRA